MKIHTYHERLRGFDRGEILPIWEASWRRHGWEPVIHYRWEADAHPDAAHYKAVITRLPTVNPPAYEQACWRRWLVAARVGGYWCDDDLVNCGFTPDDARSDVRPSVNSTLFAWHDKDHPNCGLLLGTRRDYQRFVHQVLYGHLDIGTHNGQPHTSDMFLWNRFYLCGHVESVRGAMCEHPHPARLVHCSTEAVAAAGQTKPAAMRAWLDSTAPKPA